LAAAAAGSGGIGGKSADPDSLKSLFEEAGQLCGSVREHGLETAHAKDGVSCRRFTGARSAAAGTSCLLHVYIAQRERRAETNGEPFSREHTCLSLARPIEDGSTLKSRLSPHPRTSLARQIDGERKTGKLYNTTQQHSKQGRGRKQTLPSGVDAKPTGKGAGAITKGRKTRACAPHQHATKRAALHASPHEPDEAGGRLHQKAVKVWSHR